MGVEKPLLHKSQVDDAVERVDRRISFLSHLTWFFFLSLFFVGVNLALTPNDLWCAPVVIVWGCVLICHLVAAFVIGDLRGPYRHRALKKELERLEPPNSE